MAVTVVPPPAALPDVLPTERLNRAGRPTADVREHLRRIPDGRNALTVAGAWAQSLGPVVAALAINRWWAYALAFPLTGRAFVLLNILGHESAHRLLFTNRKVNDAAGRWLVGYPALTPLDVYRRIHMAHHRDEMGPNEPDQGLYAGYPITRASLRRKLVRDGTGISGWKILKPLLVAFTKPSSRGQAARIVAAQVGVAVVLTLGGGLSRGQWWLYPVLWFLPWFTVWRVLNRLRAIAEHGGMVRSEDRRMTTHVVRQRWLARFWIVPYHTGWHLAHHADSGIPWRQLPALHAELMASGWVPPELEYRSYLALWRVLASRPAA